jgi:hypothetical protein
MAGGDEGTLVFWDIHSKLEPTQTKKEIHLGPITGLAFAPCNKHLYCTVGLDKVLRFHDINQSGQRYLYSIEQTLSSVFLILLCTLAFYTLLRLQRHWQALQSMKTTLLLLARPKAPWFSTMSVGKALFLRFRHSQVLLLKASLSSLPRWVFYEIWNAIHHGIKYSPNNPCLNKVGHWRVVKRKDFSGHNCPSTDIFRRRDSRFYLKIGDIERCSRWSSFNRTQRPGHDGHV